MRTILEVDPKRVKTHKVNWEKAYRYAKLMESGVIFPPPRAARIDNGKILIKNGAHRTTAHRLLNRMMKIRIAL